MLPTDFWQWFPDRWASSSPWNPVDAVTPYAVIESIPARSSRVVEIDWRLPPTAAEHSCLLAMATTTWDAIKRQDTVFADREIQSLVRSDKHIALCNMHVINSIAFPIRFQVRLFTTGPATRLGEMAIDTHELPGGRIRVFFTEPDGRALRVLNGRQSAFRQLTADNAAVCFELEVAKTHPATSIAHLPRITGLQLKQNHPIVATIEWLPSEKPVSQSIHRITIVQFEGEETCGGSRFIIRHS